MKSGTVKLIIKLLALGIVLLFLFNELGYLLDGSSRCYPTGKTARETDVVFLGSSHVYCNIIPQKLFDDYGITSWNIAPAEPGIKATYYALKETMRVVKPEVVVVELMMMDWNSMTEDNMNMKTNLIHEMSLFSPVHYIAAFDCEKSYGIGYEYYFNILRAHTNYNELSRDNFDALAGKDLKSIQLGYKLRQDGKVSNKDDVYKYEDIPSEDYEPIEENVKYLDKMMDYANRKNIDIVFLIAPDNREKKHDTFKWTNNHVQENGFIIYDFNTDEERKNISYSIEEHMADTNHLNIKGSLIFTEELGKRLNELYSLPDHREDSGYNAWKAHQYNYQSIEKMEKLKKEKKVKKYVTNMSELNDDYVVILCAKEDNEYLREHGITQGITFIHGDDVYTDNEELTLNIDAHKFDIIIDSEEDKTNIFVDNVKKLKDDSAACILIYNVRSNSVEDQRSISKKAKFK